MSRQTIALEQLWKKADFKPNLSQEQAIRHVEGPLYLTAGPGSGKTRVLLWRTLNLIVFHGVKPEEIFLSTFTEKAALQLREGLRALLGMVTTLTNQPYDIARMYVGTVHSLCQTLLADRRFSPDGKRPKTPALMDELAQYFHLYKGRQWAELITAADLGNDANQRINACFTDGDYVSPSRHLAVSNCISFFNRLSEECLDPAEIRRKTHDANLRLLIDLYTAYRQSLDADLRVPRTDFALLQQKALDVLNRHDSAERIFKHVIIDEYQDTNTIQERLFFALARGHKNLCVVGDDDQALYRFRGATVENFVEFPERCQRHLRVRPTKIPLNTNYRSRAHIVRFYGDFIQQHDWQKPGRAKGFYRVADKDIHAHNPDERGAVVASAPAKSEEVCEAIADLVKRLIDTKKVEDPNQIAFLYPSLKSPHAKRMIAALEARGLKAYAPRAGRFLEVPEAVALFGLYMHIFGKPERGEFSGQDYDAFHNWVDRAYAVAQALMDADSQLARYAQDRQDEIATVVADHQILMRVVKREGWDLKAPYDPDEMSAILAGTPSLSTRARRSLASPYFLRLIRRGRFTPPLGYVINRATSLDWNLLDLFYRLCGFRHFREMLDLAERGEDEGPVCNLSLIAQYLDRFMNEYASILTGEFLHEGFERTFFSSYLYVLFRRGESEYEDAEDPFPRGRIPFITIHQAKGLEFPVVVLGNPRKDDRGPQKVETMVHRFLDREGESLERMAGFDIMRMFYVALSRAKNLLVIAHFTGPGQKVNEPFKSMLDDDFPRIPNLDLKTVPAVTLKTDDLPKTYSYTADYLLYKKCPRQYMVFRKYDFVPSRSQTMFFGSLVHQTIEDLHRRLIAQRKQAAT